MDNKVVRSAELQLGEVSLNASMRKSVNFSNQIHAGEKQQHRERDAQPA
jgi:hypothetical protein